MSATAFYEFARIHKIQSIQRRRFFEDFAISAINLFYSKAHEDAFTQHDPKTQNDAQ